MIKKYNSYRQFKLLSVRVFLQSSLFLFICMINISCKKDVPINLQEINTKPYVLNIPNGFPYPDIPSDNPLTQDKINLGKQLFFDPILSRDSTVACGSCHQPNKNFTDNLTISVGINGRIGTRNAPSLMNIAYAPYLFWDGGNPTLEQQVLGPINNHNEMDYDVNKIVTRLLRHPTYPALFQKAFKEPPSVFALTRAIACYERILLSANSRFDDYLMNNDTNALTTSEKKGFAIFTGEKGDCFHCHAEYNFTDYSFRNNGLYSIYADSGRARITQKPSDYGKFKVPSLRNIEKTAPYMHDGSLATLADVVNHYNTGGKPSATKDFLIKPLNLTIQEQQDLVNFLKCLTDK